MSQRFSQRRRRQQQREQSAIQRRVWQVHFHSGPYWRLHCGFLSAVYQWVNRRSFLPLEVSVLQHDPEHSSSSLGHSSGSCWRILASLPLFTTTVGHVGDCMGHRHFLQQELYSGSRWRILGSLPFLTTAVGHVGECMGHHHIVITTMTILWTMMETAWAIDVSYH